MRRAEFAAPPLFPRRPETSLFLQFHIVFYLRCFALVAIAESTTASGSELKPRPLGRRLLTGAPRRPALARGAKRCRAGSPDSRHSLAINVEFKACLRPTSNLCDHHLGFKSPRRVMRTKRSPTFRLRKSVAPDAIWHCRSVVSHRASDLSNWTCVNRYLIIASSQAADTSC